MEEREEGGSSFTQGNQNSSALTASTFVLRLPLQRSPPHSGSLGCWPPANVSVSSLIVFGVETEASAAHRHQKTSLANMHATHHHHQIVSLSRFVLFLVLNRCMCLSVGLRTAVQVLSAFKVWKRKLGSLEWSDRQ